MSISQIYRIIDRKIPSWKATDDIPEILIISANPPPPITGGTTPEIDFWCPETYNRDGGIIDSTKIVGTTFDDQE